MYQIQVETHCHTLVSRHAHSTLAENVDAAKQQGMRALCVTNHAPASGDAPGKEHFISLKKLPREMDGIRLFRGAEVNLTDFKGGLDLENPIIAMLDWVIASIHANVLPKGSIEEITEAYCSVLSNPFIHCLGHIGRMDYLCDWDTVVKKAAQEQKIIEINNHSLSGARVGATELCPKIASLCKKYGCRIAIASDAHSKEEIGKNDLSKQLLTEIDFPKELVVNETLEKFEHYLADAGNRI